MFSDALLLPFNPCKAQYSALRPLNKGCNKQLQTCIRWLRLTSQDPPLQILTATFLCFSACGRVVVGAGGHQKGGKQVTKRSTDAHPNMHMQWHLVTSSWSAKDKGVQHNSIPSIEKLP